METELSTFFGFVRPFRKHFPHFIDQHRHTRASSTTSSGANTVYSCATMACSVLYFLANCAVRLSASRADRSCLRAAAALATAAEASASAATADSSAGKSMECKRATRREDPPVDVSSVSPCATWPPVPCFVLLAFAKAPWNLLLCLQRHKQLRQPPHISPGASKLLSTAGTDICISGTPAEPIPLGKHTRTSPRPGMPTITKRHFSRSSVAVECRELDGIGSKRPNGTGKLSTIMGPVVLCEGTPSTDKVRATAPVWLIRPTGLSTSDGGRRAMDSISRSGRGKASSML